MPSYENTEIELRQVNEFNRSTIFVSEILLRRTKNNLTDNP